MGYKLKKIRGVVFRIYIYILASLGLCAIFLSLFLATFKKERMEAENGLKTTGVTGPEKIEIFNPLKR